MDQLNQADRELLEGILMKSPSELTPEEIAVLNARRSYLSYPQRLAYKDVLVDGGELSEQSAETPTQEWTEPAQPTQQATEAMTSEQAPAEAVTEPAQPDQTQANDPYGVDNPSELA